ncbi:MAG: M12 family metallo-peptidase, partial [Bacteroidota bacterium]|nr:M12 family metallo-peptidase [Bacteroidota bacterium]
MVRVYFLLITLFISSLAVGQRLDLVPTQADPSNPFFAKFKKYQTFSLDAERFRAVISKQESNIYNVIINANTQFFSLTLFEYDIFAKNFAGTRISPHNKTIIERNKTLRTFRGVTRENQGKTSTMTIAENFLMISYMMDNEEFFLERIPDLSGVYSPTDQFILYKASDVIAIPGVSCGADMVKNQSKQMIASEVDEKNKPRTKGCVEVEIALAADWPYTRQFGGQPGAENMMASILNLVQANWDDEFPTEIIYVITGFFTPIDSASDPFMLATDIFEHLQLMFYVGAGLLPPHDVATGWTNRYMSGTVGVASFRAVCNSDRYNICSHFTVSINDVRQLQSHELGHNFACFHDGGGQPFIMAPVINGTSQWSFYSYIQVNWWTQAVQCLSPCAGVDPPPIIEFEADPLYSCAPNDIQFTDLSQYVTTWKWSFPGGIPSTSTSPNPIVRYNTKGIYNVTLEGSNPRC